MRVGRAEALAQIDGFVDDHAIRNVEALLQLVHADHQDRGLDRIELLERPVEERRQRGLDAARACAMTLAEQLLEVLAIDAGRILALQELLLDLGGRLLRQLPLIERLHRQLARDGARARAARPLHYGFRRLSS